MISVLVDVHLLAVEHAQTIGQVLVGVKAAVKADVMDVLAVVLVLANVIARQHVPLNAV